MSVRSTGRRESISMSMDGFDENDSEKDETKRKSRNLSEKKRRDQFNILVTELGAMVSNSNRKMDKTTVLKTTIAFLKQHNEQSLRSQAEEIQEDWKPSFLSNEEFAQLMLEAIDGFILVLGIDGHIMFTSESLASLLGYLPASLHNTTLYEIVGDVDKIPLYNHLNMSNAVDSSPDNQIKLTLHIRRSPNGIFKEETSENGTAEAQLELVELSGYFRKWSNPEPAVLLNPDSYFSDNEVSGLSTPTSQQADMQASSHFRATKSPDKTVFVATGRLATPQLLRELPVVHNSHSGTEFVSRHSMEWKYIYVDHRAPPIIGYLPFELLGTSGYDHYHIDDLDQVAACHEALRQTGECTSCFYRFLTKGQQWIWLKSRYYITYHQWNSKPEFIVANHKVVNYMEVLDLANKPEKVESLNDSATERKTHSFRSGSPTLSSKSSLCGSTGTGFASSSRISQDTGGDNSSGFKVNTDGYRRRFQQQQQQQASGGANSDTGMSGMQIQQENSIMSDDMSGMDDSVSGAENVCNNPPVPVPAAVPVAPPAPLIPSNSVVLTQAQVVLQEQLKYKHLELTKMIAQQQRELKLLGEQLMLTHVFPGGMPPPPNSSSSSSNTTAVTPPTHTAAVVNSNGGNMSVVAPAVDGYNPAAAQQMLDPSQLQQLQQQVVIQQPHVSQQQQQHQHLPQQLPQQASALPQLVFNNDSLVGEIQELEQQQLQQQSEDQGLDESYLQQSGKGPQINS